ncbi:hypothetical protein AMS68_004898 [Peltaster fructicola]|uniref:WD-like domain-containing protein n=1 Tax=Peltaster fructicola TaxID=286661 RepID=A0A6H0XXJ5_9PEZI|nr:hypothetical protein AMS68_004898 [Peltaster fructicola]
MHHSDQDILFCQQFALEVLITKNDSDSQQIAQEFIDRYPLTSNAITSPRTWAKGNTSQQRFKQTATSLLKPTLTSVLSKMFSVQRLAFYFAAGLVGTAVFNAASASAMPLEGLTGVIKRSMDIHYKGEFVDAVTNLPFDLYSEDAALEPATAFSYYLAGANDTELDKRSWYNCEHLTNLQTLGCNTAHGIGSFVSATGASAAGSYIAVLLGEAFNGIRDNKKPRSVCISRDGANLCVSWATYDTASLKSGEPSDIANFAVSCGKSGGSSEFKTVMSDGGILFICVSNRATGCGQGVC